MRKTEFKIPKSRPALRNLAKTLLELKSCGQFPGNVSKSTCRAIIRHKLAETILDNSTESGRLNIIGTVVTKKGEKILEIVLKRLDS